MEKSAWCCALAPGFRCVFESALAVRWGLFAAERENGRCPLTQAHWRDHSRPVRCGARYSSERIWFLRGAFYRTVIVPTPVQGREAAPCRSIGLQIWRPRGFDALIWPWRWLAGRDLLALQRGDVARALGRLQHADHQVPSAIETDVSSVDFVCGNVSRTPTPSALRCRSARPCTP